MDDDCMGLMHWVKAWVWCEWEIIGGLWCLNCNETNNKNNTHEIKKIIEYTYKNVKLKPIKQTLSF